MPDVSAADHWLTGLQLLLLAGVLSLLPLSVWVWRTRTAPPSTRLRALTALTLFLTFDLIVFGAFTRLSDSGLGCPDWPGCYAEATPWAAHEEIRAAQSAQPTGPVTFSKAWIEMIHRYLAMTVGALILLSCALSWRWRAQVPQGWKWPLATLVWVLVQGLFGKYTVTLKLYPAIVTLHLMGGVTLLALLVVQHERYLAMPVAVSTALRRGLWLVLGLLAVQVALGGWVSTNYAVLACRGFPTCNGQWWPDMDAGHGFTVLRELGRAGSGEYLPANALVAIHMAHRLMAVVVLAALLSLALACWRSGGAMQRTAVWLLGLSTLQLATGLSNVVLHWPLLGALLHTGGAAALVAVLVAALQRTTLPKSSISPASAFQSVRTA